MVSTPTPTLANIRHQMSLTDLRALLSIAICEVCDFFNVGKNMNDTQVAKTVDLIIEEFWYLKLEEIKYCFHRAMRTERLFDRLDGNIILSWLEAYDAERTEQAIDISHNEEVEAKQRVSDNPEGKDFKTYLAELKERAKTDKSAAELLANYEAIQSVPTIGTTRKNDDHKFKLFKYNYLLGKKRNET